MAKMGRYCKAYPVERFREFPGWPENPNTSPRIQPEEKASACSVRSDSKTEEVNYLFLQENFVVTNGIFIDENIVFNDISNQWESFCREILKFEIPPDVNSEQDMTA